MKTHNYTHQKPKPRNAPLSSIQNLFKTFLKVNHLEDKIKEASLPDVWAKVAGQYIASRTNKVWLKGDVLFVSVSSSCLRNELAFDGGRYLAAIQEQVSKFKKIHWC
ncbi:MAG: DciA family protein [Microscillaceae bacterium]|nr:DciA family protein [Microscillaceae bacterium]